MARIISKSKREYLYERDNIKICPHCKEMISYSFLDLKVVGIGLNRKNYITCPNCQHEIIIEFTTTDHM